MRPGTFGRALGIGARLFTQRVLPPSTPAERRAASERRVSRGERVGRHASGVGRGSRNFGRAVWNPFAHASSILWLEITGMFFALFALFFAQHLWAVRAAFRTGAEHGHFLTYAALCLVFAYFAGSSFARARAQTRRRAREQRLR